jgi:hypothetical protein
LDDMLVIVAGIFLLFVGFLLHTNFVPFKRKFHNVMDYFVIIVTMTTLFFGLLFFVDRFPEGTKSPLEYLAFAVIIGSTLIVVSMILWDANTRRKNDKKKLKLKLRNILRNKEHNEDMRTLLVQLHERDEKDDMFHVTEVPWNVDYEYKLLHFETDSETPEEVFTHMNDIFFNLLSWERIKRKLFLVRRKGMKTSSKIVKKFKKKSKEDKELEIYLKELQKNDPEFQKKFQKYKSENKMDRKMSKKFEKHELKKKMSEFKFGKTDSFMNTSNNDMSSSNSLNDIPNQRSFIKLLKKDKKEVAVEKVITGSVTKVSKSKKNETKPFMDISGVENDTELKEFSEIMVDLGLEPEDQREE